MSAAITTNSFGGGGSIPTASLNINLSGDLVVQGNAADANTFGQVPGAYIAIQNSGGTIDTNATLNLSANNISGNILLDIFNGGSRTIG